MRRNRTEQKVEKYEQSDFRLIAINGSYRQICAPSQPSGCIALEKAPCLSEMDVFWEGCLGQGGTPQHGAQMAIRTAQNVQNTL